MQFENKTNFSIVVPLFNEADNIFPLVQTITATVGEDERFLEIVLVDDGSRDETADLALRLAERDRRVRLVRHKRNQGLGAAIRTGLSAAQGDFVLYTDADLPFDFKLIPQLLAQSGDNRVLSGYRLNRGEGGRRWILTTVYNFLVWLFFGLSMNDVNFACKIFPKSFLQATRFNSSGSFIDVEILLEARRLGYEITEHPLVYYPRTRGLSTLSRPQVILFILHEMFAYTRSSFSSADVFLKVAKHSPLAKILVCSAAILTSAIFLSSENLWFRTSLYVLPAIALTAMFLFFIVAFSRAIYRKWKIMRESLSLKTSE